MSSRREHSGLILVTVLWIVALLGLIAAITGRTCRLDTKVCLWGGEHYQCKWACRAGVETAIAVLNDDLRASDSLSDLWSDNEVDLNDVSVGSCRFTVKVIDEAGKLNINTATKDQLLALPEMEEEIADAIIDWRDRNDRPQAEGAEGGYYLNLDFGYGIRNGPFKTIREMLLVKGVTDEQFYGQKNQRAVNDDSKVNRGWINYLTCYSVDKNKDASDNRRVNINEADEGRLERSLSIKKAHAKWIVENKPNDNYKSISDLINKNSPKKSSKEDSDEAQAIDLETFSNIADKITISGDEEIPGKVNINTASKEVLTALLGGGQADEQTAQNIINYRENLLSGMESIAELLEVKSMSIDTFKKIANYVTTRSDFFTVRCRATAIRDRDDGTILLTEAVVNRRTQPCQILYWYQGGDSFINN